MTHGLSWGTSPLQSAMQLCKRLLAPKEPAKARIGPAAQPVLLGAFVLAPGSVSVFQVLNCVLLQLLYGSVLVYVAICLDLR